ncbi:hypothetical protein XENOCAPTIV_022365, partial [Xenoophorus captivus]
ALIRLPGKEVEASWKRRACLEHLDCVPLTVAPGTALGCRPLVHQLVHRRMAMGQCRCTELAHAEMLVILQRLERGEVVVAWNPAGLGGAHARHPVKVPALRQARAAGILFA